MQCESTTGPILQNSVSISLLHVTKLPIWCWSMQINSNWMPRMIFQWNLHIVILSSWHSTQISSPVCCERQANLLYFHCSQKWIPSKTYLPYMPRWVIVPVEFEGIGWNYFPCSISLFHKSCALSMQNQYYFLDLPAIHELQVEKSVFHKIHSKFQWDPTMNTREIDILLMNVQNLWLRGGGIDQWNGKILVPPLKMLIKGDISFWGVFLPTALLL